ILVGSIARKIQIAAEISEEEEKGPVTILKKCAEKLQIVHGPIIPVNAEAMEDQVIPAKEHRNMQSFAEKIPINVDPDKRVLLKIHNKEKNTKNIAGRTQTDVNMIVRLTPPAHILSQQVARAQILRANAQNTDAIGMEVIVIVVIKLLLAIRQLNVPNNLGAAGQDLLVIAHQLKLKHKHKHKPRPMIQPLNAVSKLDVLGTDHHANAVEYRELPQIPRFSKDFLIS
ncbi:MAG: hypothetical protein HYV38_02405, partial [Candidatus Levybacteria bacterium]|nr:hypothetical protein [Candidatus Levybacteria bacterium]